MSGAALLVLTAAVLSVEDGQLRIDKGLADGLEPGDRGTVYYELKIGSQTRTIEVGEAAVVEISETSALAQPADGVEARPGHRMRFRLPGSRLLLSGLLEATRSHLGEAEREEAFMRMLDGRIPADEAVERRILELFEQRRRQRVADRESPGAAAAPGPPAVLAVAGGSYRIGLDLPTARYFNQQPSFEIPLEPFWIDRRPVSERAFRRVAGAGGRPAGRAAGESPVREITYGQAAAHCAAIGGRLPTEFEWEAAARLPEFEAPSYLFEWTGSWYLPYAGNTHAEREYGTTRRVLRRLGGGADETRRRRYFADPELLSDDVGFRCVREREP